MTCVLYKNLVTIKIERVGLSHRSRYYRSSLVPRHLKNPIFQAPGNEATTGEAVPVAGVSNCLTGTLNGKMEWKIEWNNECTKLTGAAQSVLNYLVYL